MVVRSTKQWQEGNGNRYAEKRTYGKSGSTALCGNDDGRGAALSGQGRTVAGSDGAFIGAGYGSLAVGSILHCSCECVYDDQRILFMRKLF